MPTNTIAMQTSPANELAPDQISINRRLQMAKMLQDQAMAPTEQQIVGGRVVPISPWQGAARLAQALAGNKMQSGAEEQTRTANQAYSQRLAETLKAFGQEQDPQKKASILMAHPATQQAGMKMIEQMGQPRKPLVVGRTLMDETGKQLGVDSTWQAEQQAAREAKKAELEARLADQRISREESAALRRELAANASADRRMIASMVDARREQKNVPKLPTSALKMQQEELDAIGTASAINADLGAIAQQIESGKLKLGMVDNLAAKAKNFVGASDESSRNLATFQATLEKQRNDSLRLNKGVQTEGDAVRAWNELMTNINDPKLVKQRLAEIQKINERAANLRQMNVETIRQNFGVEPLDTTPRKNQPAAVGGGASGGWSIQKVQ